MPTDLIDKEEPVASGRVLVVEGGGFSYARAGDAGIDLTASEDSRIPPGGISLVPTGIRMVLPSGTFGAVCPRSGLAAKGITVMNAPGIVDQGYRGEVKVILVNHTAEEFNVKKGMRIAQMVVMPFVRCSVVEGEVSSFSSERGCGGFGSTGD